MQKYNHQQLKTTNNYLKLLKTTCPKSNIFCLLEENCFTQLLFWMKFHNYVMSWNKNALNQLNFPICGKNIHLSDEIKIGNFLLQENNRLLLPIPLFNMLPR